MSLQKMFEIGDAGRGLRRLREAGVTRGRFFSPIFAMLRCDKRTVPAVPPPQRTEELPQRYSLLPYHGNSPAHRHQTLEKGGTEGRFFCHTAGGTKEPSLCNAGRKLPVAVKGVVSVNTPPTTTDSVPRARRTTRWLLNTYSSRKPPEDSPGVSPVGGRGPLTGRF